ncbi:hypothetical protein Acr_07g0012450 [Actinidia rufa]|uniref:non-specific serine/threonine protein kinase n=1 Tax=Actinidia rufa TaxID=165716 RepID=A0A7J0EYI9_9ERIC|nr:hypothetical protein Acr_07g0012450 [Actinidia rufa]
MHHKSSISIFSILTLLTTVDLAFSQPPPANICSLDIQIPSSGNDSNCIKGNWGGFLNGNCCGFAFDVYLQALGKRTNQTGQIFLNSTDQIDCLVSMKTIEGDVLNCGIEKLSSGAGGCYDYSVTDVVNNLGNRLRTLDEGCKVLGLDQQSDKACSACSRSWDDMGISLNNRGDRDICRFAVLVSLTSTRIGDEKWIQALYKCLGEQSIIPIESKYSLSKESGCHEVTIKEVYSATNNLNESNFIGQGTAGKVYKGILSNGQHVAVKHIPNDGEMETFVREVTSLSPVRHPNLVTLLGHCKGEEECFLIYELCHNGNLSKWLFGEICHKGWEYSGFADPKLNGDYSSEAFEVVFKLALSCIGLKQQRPTMEQVVVRLEKALDISVIVDPINPHFIPQ